jgi:hypothetical protein
MVTLKAACRETSTSVSAPLIDVAALEARLRLLRHVIALGGPSSAGAREIARRIERRLRGAVALFVDEVAEAA